MPNRGPKITKYVKELIQREAIGQRAISRQLLARQLIKRLETEGEIPPGEDTIIKMISSARNHYNPLNEEFSIGAMRDYNIDSRVLKSVFELKSKGINVTIRQVLWMSRFFHIDLPTGHLFSLAYSYALDEEVAEINQTDTFVTHNSDKFFESAFREGKFPQKPTEDYCGILRERVRSLGEEYCMKPVVKNPVLRKKEAKLPGTIC